LCCWWHISGKWQLCILLIWDYFWLLLVDSEKLTKLALAKMTYNLAKSSETPPSNNNDNWCMSLIILLILARFV
jgi:hypothetical protein